MKIVVFGATGGTGKQIVSQALELGFEVGAFVRYPAKLTLKNPKLSLVKGDILDSESVSRVLIGVDAVLVALGSDKQYWQKEQ